MGEPYKKLLSVVMSMFYAILTIVGITQIPPLFATYIPGVVGEAITGFCLLMLGFYVLTLIAIYWD